MTFFRFWESQCRVNSAKANRPKTTGWCLNLQICTVFHNLCERKVLKFSRGLLLPKVYSKAVQLCELMFKRIDDLPSLIAIAYVLQFNVGVMKIKFEWSDLESDTSSMLSLSPRQVNGTTQNAAANKPLSPRENQRYFRFRRASCFKSSTNTVIEAVHYRIISVFELPDSDSEVLVYV